MLGGPAFHGTPHKWESGAPDLSKVGTGEGAQAYGHGIYFAENPDVAKSYSPRDFDAEEIMMQKYKEAEAVGDYNRMEQWESAMLHDTPDEIRARSLDMDYDEDYRRVAAEVADELEAIPSSSHLYEVDIPDADIDRMLDWDAPLSDLPQNARERLLTLEDSMDGTFWDNDLQVLESLKGKMPDRTFTGEDLLGDLGTVFGHATGRETSEYLNSLGIPGIKYLDQGSRDANKGTRNFVVFDEKLLNKMRIK